uniref:Olfactory receptor n=1 Tax=Geotrypetes seraphini TaxID=260995 RepID=A0A6P8PWU8_GEOSA|nr:olfactory receptor 5V1-like [Geotrypetes seraphini]
MGNLTIITVTYLDHRLHTPMYFFLSNLSFLDISSISVTIPKLLDILLHNSYHISVNGCFTQLYFFLSLASVELLLLTIMAYDRYVAICHPLRYSVIMSQRLCLQMAAGTWLIGFLETVAYPVLFTHLSYCGSNQINHFFCDLSALPKLSCTSTSNIEHVTYILGVFIETPCFFLILISYIHIISSILRINSVEGRRKAFSTCASHLTVVILFYGTMMCLYLRPTSIQSPEQNKFFALLYNVLIPLLNPLIYSLKNKDVKQAIQKAFHRKLFS